MGSVYQRQDSKFLWISYSHNGKVKCESIMWSACCNYKY